MTPLSSRDARVLRLVVSHPGEPAEQLRIRYIHGGGRHLASGAAVGALLRLVKLELVKLVRRPRLPPVYVATEKGVGQVLEWAREALRA